MSHVTRTPHLKSNGQKSRSPGRCAQRCVGMSGGCSSGLENVLVVGNCCYVAICSVVEGASASRGGEGWGYIMVAACLQLVQHGMQKKWEGYSP